ncbi:MAG: PIN domain-containing protein [Candidatus Heimdallarchaeota archaeon]|nr:PIN domain-containing protein [Candidatus Heimdallarchaeota archaeon]
MSKRPRIPIFIDTNVLLHHFEFKINIEEAINRIITRKYEIFVHRLVEEEILEALKKKGKVARNAKVAVQLMSRYKEYDDQIEYPGTDIALMEAAEKEKGCVLTFDKDLKQRCKLQGVAVISLYKQGRLSLVGEIE